MQLGLAHMVFPGAGYSRFSHCLGVCHVSGRILSALKAGSVSITDEEVVRYRLAGLLHDVGHYPFSHATEDALSRYFASQLIEGGAGEGGPPKTWWDHEALGKAILQSDEELASVLTNAGIAPEEIYKIFTREKPPRFSNLISSDLDADRIDYLMRTAHFTGLPYGTVDLDYLLAHLVLDNENQICVHPKALRTVEHFLLARYFDFQQVSYHKTVAGLELVLKDVLRALLDEGYLKVSAAEVKVQIANGSWVYMDDVQAMQLIREHAKASLDPVRRQKADVILRRRPPKQIAFIERLASRDDDEKNRFLGERQQVIERVKKWASDFGIHDDLWYVWHKSGQALTKIGSRIPVSAAGREDTEELIVQAIRVLSPDGSSKPLMEVKRSLINALADKALYTLRVYVVLATEDEEKKRDAITKRVRDDLKHFEWL